MRALPHGLDNGFPHDMPQFSMSDIIVCTR